jgi:hypothetical protein
MCQSNLMSIACAGAVSAVCETLAARGSCRACSALLQVEPNLPPVWNCRMDRATNHWKRRCLEADCDIDWFGETWRFAGAFPCGRGTWVTGIG